jgi:quercetin dioxygenase-like cupin family protein
MSLNTIDQSQAQTFRYDTRDVDWKDFITEGCYYRLLDVNVETKTADMLVKFEPGAQCLYHRHVAATTSLVLEGELCVVEKTAGGEIVKVKPAGTFTSGTKDEVHIEGGGDAGVIVYFSMRGDTDRIYDLLDEDLTLTRPITIHDFAKDYLRWS